MTRLPDGGRWARWPLLLALFAAFIGGAVSVVKSEGAITVAGGILVASALILLGVVIAMEITQWHDDNHHGGDEESPY